MKRLSIICVSLFACFLISSAQKVVVVDIEYILTNIPQYEAANDQLNQLSQRWQKEIEQAQAELQTMYQNYQTELVFLTPEMKKQREDEIIAKERETNEKKKEYFGADGKLFKRREILIKPIQDEIYNAIQDLSNSKKYDIILDKNSNVGIVFATPKVDISDEVLTQLGYSKAE